MPVNLDSEKEAMIREQFPHFPFPAFLGMEIEGLQSGIAKLSLKHRPELTQGMGILHGGVVTALCDTAVGVALMTMIADDDKILTLEMKVNFLAPADDDVVSEARIIHKGHKTAVGDVEIKKPDGTLVAKALVTYYVYRD